MSWLYPQLSTFPGVLCPKFLLSSFKLSQQNHHLCLGFFHCIFFVVVVVLLHLCFLSPTQRVPNSQTFIWNMSQEKQPRSRGSTACLWGGGMVAVFCSLLGTAEFWSTSKVFSANEQCSKMSTEKRHCFFINPEEGWLHNPRSSNFFPLFTLQLCKDRYCVRAKKRLFLQTLG